MTHMWNHISKKGKWTLGPKILPIIFFESSLKYFWELYSVCYVVTATMFIFRLLPTKHKMVTT